MSPRDLSLTIALCASLAVHALLLGSAAEMYARMNGSSIRLPGFPPNPTLTALLVEEPVSIDPANRLGDSSGVGDALNSSLGDEPMQAAKANQTQAFLSLDPQGMGTVGDEPVESALPLGQAATPSPPHIAEQLAQAPPPAAFGMPGSGGDFALPALPDPKPRRPAKVEAEDAREAIPPVEASAAPTARSQQASPSPGIESRPGAAVSADPAPMAESESDPTTTVGAVEFRPGSTNVRLGRKHKLIRPRLTIAAKADLLVLPSPTVVLRIKIDETGKVTSAEIVRSSGSNEVDQPCKLVAYEWWFEPLKDKSGRPIRDEIIFAVRFI